MRRHRLGAFKQEYLSTSLSQESLSKEWKHYCGRERAHLRKLRTRMRMTSFQIVSQIGQGGYGKVILVSLNRSHFPGLSRKAQGFLGDLRLETNEQESIKENGRGV